jgi:DNA-binding LacI/PurR family transcriptional regulator
LFGALPHPDGLVIGDDILTRELLTAAVGAGVRVGQYLRIASHTNKGSPTLREWAGRLTAIEVDPDEIVEAMFGMLERLMDGEEVEQQTVIVKPRIRRD